MVFHIDPTSITAQFSNYKKSIGYLASAKNADGPYASPIIKGHNRSAAIIKYPSNKLKSSK